MSGRGRLVGAGCGFMGSRRRLVGSSCAAATAALANRVLHRPVKAAVGCSVALRCNMNTLAASFRFLRKKKKGRGADRRLAKHPRA